jgi:hypothetical protein
MHCPGSVKAAAEAPAPPVSAFAAEGTETHHLFAKCLEDGVAPETLTNDLSLHAPLAIVADQTRAVIDGRAVLLEHKLPPLPDLPQVWGTTDCVTFEFERVDGLLTSVGVGVVVDPDTPQLAIYALLAARHFGMSATGITVTIVQPRSGLLRSHHYSPEALDRFEQTLRAALQRPSSQMHHAMPALGAGSTPPPAPARSISACHRFQHHRSGAAPRRCCGPGGEHDAIAVVQRPAPPIR